MALHDHTPKQRKKIKKDKAKGKKKSKKKLVPDERFDPAHPGLSTLRARKLLRDERKKKNGR